MFKAGSKGGLGAAVVVGVVILLWDLSSGFQHYPAVLFILDAVLDAMLIPVLVIQLRMREVWLAPGVLSASLAVSAVKWAVRLRWASLFMVGADAFFCGASATVAVAEGIRAFKRHRILKATGGWPRSRS
jgi:hypothetical protein